MNVQNKAVELILCAASGVGAAVLFDFPQAAFLCWGVLVPAFFVLLRNREDPKRLLQCCGVLAVSFFAVYYAAFFTLDVSLRMGAEGLFALTGGFLVATALHGAILCAALFAGFRVSAPPCLRAVLAGVLWAGAEWLMGAGVLGFPCMRLAATQASDPAMLGTLPLLGSLFLSFLIVTVNVLAAQGIFFLVQRDQKRGALCFVVAVAVVAVNVVCGGLQTAVPEGRTPVRFAAVQYNMPSAESARDGRYEKALEIARRSVDGAPQIILLPENSVFGSLAKDAELQRPLRELAENGDAYVLTGVYGIHGFQTRNSVFMMKPDGALDAPYHKQRLVPFFENGYDQPFTMQIGEERGVFQTKYGAVGAVICFESMFSDAVSDTVREGAELVVVFTNDSWFRGPVAPRRHFAHAVLRAAETGRYVIQASNNGITGVVSPDGTVLDTLPMDTDGFLAGTVLFLNEKTPYTGWSDWWIALLLGSLAAFLVIRAGRRRSK